MNIVSFVAKDPSEIVSKLKFALSITNCIDVIILQ